MIKRLNILNAMFCCKQNVAFRNFARSWTDRKVSKVAKWHGLSVIKRGGLVLFSKNDKILDIEDIQELINYEMYKYK